MFQVKYMITLMKLLFKHGSQKEKAWNDLFDNYKEAYPELAEQLEAAINGELPDGWEQRYSSL